jgi:heme/copper-type cytochrome/quinol oxidase subunit 2
MLCFFVCLFVCLLVGWLVGWLVFIAIPSLRLLYLTDEIHNPVITLKAAGHQWYWSYEYSDFTKLEFDLYIIQQEDSQDNTFRLLDTDNRVVLPINSPIRLIVTAAEVLHAWTVPRPGVKRDATPGRLNQVRLFVCLLVGWLVGWLVSQLITRSSRQLQLVQNSGDQRKAAGKTKTEQAVH